MDIKNIARNLIPLGSAKAAAETTSARSKTDADNDREGSGQASGGGEEQKRRKPTPKEVADAVAYLEGLQGVKDNNLTVRSENKDGVTVVFVEDRDGKIIRRIPENELAALTANRERKSGHLLNRPM